MLRISVGTHWHYTMTNPMKESGSTDDPIVNTSRHDKDARNPASHMLTSSHAIHPHFEYGTRSQRFLAMLFIKF